MASHNDVIDLIVDYSNLYTSQKNDNPDITHEEIWTFTGILLLSGCICLPRREMYWENLEDSNNKLVTHALSRDRFRYIIKNLHVRDNNNLARNVKFANLRMFFDLLNKNVLQFAPISENHSVGEAMGAYYGRHSCK